MAAHLYALNFKSLRNFPSGNRFKFSGSDATTQKKPDPLVCALAHEIRNPLATINLAVDLLKCPAKVHNDKLYLDIILTASRQIDALITDLLTSGKPGEIQSEKYFVHELLDEALATMQNRILLKNIAIRKDYTTLDCKIFVNRQEIKIALTNLITNAIEAMPAAKGKLTLITRSINGECVIVIEDNGIGIGKEDLKNIFTPYFTGKAGGLGLGLSTTRDILDSNHATVEVRSEPGKGTRFILTFGKIQEF